MLHVEIILPNLYSLLSKQFPRQLLKNKRFVLFIKRLKFRGNVYEININI